jgi:hypothetical protein
MWQALGCSYLVEISTGGSFSQFSDSNMIEVVSREDIPFGIQNNSQYHIDFKHIDRRNKLSRVFEVGYSGKRNGNLMKGFPTVEEVETANKEQLARWYRFLPSGEPASEQKIMTRIAERFEKLGGMTPQLSKKIGM